MEIAEKKRAILESALELITENGFHGCPMSQVAQKACVAAGTIYHYFESKDELIKELCNYVKDERMSFILLKDDPKKNFKERFFTFWINVYEYYLSHPKSLIFLEQYSNSPYFVADPKKWNERFYKMVTRFLQSGINRGLVRPMDIKLLIFLIHNSIMTTAKIHLRGIVDITEENLQEAVQYAWDGIKSK